MDWKTINSNKNIILAVFFGAWAGIKEHSLAWGLFIVALGFGLFCLIDWFKAPLGKGPLDRYIGIKPPE